ncbi:glypican-5b isoform X2 [Brienomyrus brachyistius]|uniref:glypican-5b isoform X2 n=1 Tax=Brienomyrus brachyistius TaxID=42636 RepID=UPI0020B3A4AB|nr:glypican-5b isoform X2 [Brienomyrus brachyistius]
MSRARLLRVHFWSALVATALLLVAPCVKAHSCHEVKTAFQLRHIGPLKWVPEAPGTDADLQICKHQGPTCCTRKMEESYQAAVRRETLQNIRSYSFELKYLIMGHATSFQDTFQSLVSFAMNHTLALFDTAYQPLARDARPPMAGLFGDLALFLQGGAVTAEGAVGRFFDELFPLVYGRLLTPGSPAPVAQRAECLRATRRDLSPFGPHPQALAAELERALRAGRALSRALAAGAEALNATESAVLSRECGRALVRMQYCPHCRGLTLVRPCAGYCLNVMRGCLAGLSELDAPWRRYVAVLEGLTGALAGAHDLELALLGIREQVNEAILYTQLHGPRISATVDKVCGQNSEASSAASTSQPPPATSSLSPPNPRHEAPLDRLAHLKREFMSYIQRYRTFFATLPEMLCETEMVDEFWTCWNGEEVVESYSGRVVGSGLQAQKLNPEIKVRSADPVLLELKEKLELFNQEMVGEATLVRSSGVWLEAGSGVPDASGECDDEDGCQGSGFVAAAEDEDGIDTFHSKGDVPQEGPPSREPPAPPHGPHPERWFCCAPHLCPRLHAALAGCHPLPAGVTNAVSPALRGVSTGFTPAPPPPAAVRWTATPELKAGWGWTGGGGRGHLSLLLFLDSVLIGWDPSGCGLGGAGGSMTAMFAICSQVADRM